MVKILVEWLKKIVEDAPYARRKLCLHSLSLDLSGVSYGVPIHMYLKCNDMQVKSALPLRGKAVAAASRYSVGLNSAVRTSWAYGRRTDLFAWVLCASDTRKAKCASCKKPATSAIVAFAAASEAVQTSKLSIII
mgnify:CR=1 FL=1